MKVAFVVVLVVVLFGAFAGWYFLTQDKRECERSQIERQSLLLAMRAKNADFCSTMPEIQKQRCTAYANEDSSLCEKYDLDCIAISERNESKCIEPTCRALASRDTSKCEELGEDSEWCRNLASLNAEYFNEERC